MRIRTPSKNSRPASLGHVNAEWVYAREALIFWRVKRNAEGTLPAVLLFHCKLTPEKLTRIQKLLAKEKKEG
jgi:hypothetical protein